MNVKKFTLYIFSLLIVSVGLTGCSTPSKAEVKAPTQAVQQAVVTPPKVEELNADLIKIKDELTFNYKDGIGTEVMGSATNNNKLECNFDFEVFFSNPDGTLLTSEVFSVTDIKAGETKLFSNKVMDKDLTKTTHKIQFGEFFTYTK